MQVPPLPNAKTEAQNITEHLGAVWRHLRDFSPARFDVYALNHGPAPADACAFYQWNAEVRAALLPTLDAVEVLLRNSIDRVMVQKHGEFWFEGEVDLEEGEERAIVRAQTDAKSKEKRRGRESTHHDVIVEIGFRFWVNLLKAEYSDAVWSHLLHGAFQYLPKETKDKRKTVRRHLVQACDLRNRVCHGERVIHMTNLSEIHRESIEVVGWMSRPYQRIVSGRDRFPHVWENGLAECKAALVGMVPKLVPPPMP